MSYSLFALQLFLDLRVAASLRDELHGYIVRSPVYSTYGQRNEFYRVVAQRMAPLTSSFELGVWDYVSDGPKALKEYRDWCEGTVGDARQRISGAVDGPYRGGDGGPSYMFLTVLLLMQQGAAADRVVAQRCAIPEAAYWLRGTFTSFLEMIAALNFATVRGDAVYLLPGNPDNGVRGGELADPSCAYLQRLS